MNVNHCYVLLLSIWIVIGNSLRVCDYSLVIYCINICLIRNTYTFRVRERHFNYEKLYEMKLRNKSNESTTYKLRIVEKQEEDCMHHHSGR